MPVARLQLVAVVVPPLISNPKAVAAVPTWTERLEGSTATLRLENVAVPIVLETSSDGALSLPEIS